MSECSDIYAALARLERKIDSIPRVNEQAIIQKSVNLSKSAILPQLANYAPLAAFGAVQSKVNLLGGKVNTLGNSLDGLRYATNQVGERVNVASKVANQAKTATDSLGRNIIDQSNKLGKLGSELVKIDQKTNGLLSKINQLGSKLGSLASKVAPLFNLVGAVAGLYALYATLRIVFPRLDAHDRELDAQRQALSDNLSAAHRGVNLAKAAQRTADEGLAKANEAATSAYAVNQSAYAAQRTANEGVARANTAARSAEKAQTTADNATRRANTAIDDANRAQRSADDATTRANNAATNANRAQRSVDDATTRANGAQSKASDAQRAAESAIRRANEALAAISGLRDIAEQGQRLGAAAMRGVNELRDRLNNFLKNQPSSTPTTPQIQQQVAQQIAPYKAQSDKALVDLFNQLNTNKQTTTNLQQTINKQTVRIQQIQQSPTATPNQIPAIQQEITRLQQKTIENEKMNQRGLDEILKIGTGLAAVTVLLKQIPDSTVTKIKAPLEIITRQTSPDALSTAAATGTCRTTQPGGCTTKAVNQGNQSLQDWMKQNLGNLINAGDTAIDIDTNRRVRNIQDKLGTNKYPMILPEYLLDDYLDKTVVINDQVDFQVWSLKQWDALIGLFPIKIERTDENGNKQMLKFENIAEAIAEITGLLAAIAFDADTAVNVATRATAEAIGSKTAVVQAISYLKAIVDHMGFQGQTTSIDVPISVTPGAIGADGKLQENELKDFLKPSTQKTIGFKNTDPVDMRLILRRILEDGEISRAALYRPLKPEVSQNTLTGDAIKKEKTDEKARLNDLWEEFKKRYEGHTAGTKIDIDDGTQASNNEGS